MLGTGVLAVVNNCGIKKVRMLFAHVNISMVHRLRELWILHSFWSVLIGVLIMRLLYTALFENERLHFKKLSPQENCKKY